MARTTKAGTTKAGTTKADTVELTPDQIAALQAAHDELLAWWQPHKDVRAEAQAWWNRHEDAVQQITDTAVPMVSVGNMAEILEWTVRDALRDLDPQRVASKLKQKQKREQERERRRQRAERREREREREQEQDQSPSQGQRSQQREQFQTPPWQPLLDSRPHAVLHVASDAPLVVAEAAFRALSKSAHPDAGGTHEHMKRLNAAITAFRAARSRAG